jgi:PAS domain S-box-containing protein
MTPSPPPSIVEYVKELESKDAGILVAVFDRDGYYLYASANHEPALGYTAEELLNMHLSQVVDKAEHRAAWVLRTIAVFYTRPIPFSTRLVSKSEKLVPITGTLSHLRDSRGEMYFITSVKPVSEPE